MTLVALLPLLFAQETPEEEPASEETAEIETFEEMEEDGVGQRRGAARPALDTSGYTALNLHLVHDAEAIVTTGGFAPDLSGLRFDFRPARPVSARVHVAWSPEAGFLLPEAYGELDFFRAAVSLRAGRWLLPVGLFNAERYAAHTRILPELPIAASTLIGLPQSADGLLVRADRGLGLRSTLDGALWLVNAPQSSYGSFDVGLPAEMTTPPYAGNTTPLAVGGRVAYSLGESFSAGLSGQLGDTSTDGSTSLALGAIHAAYVGARLRADAELLAAQQQILADFGPLRVNQTALTVAAGYAVVPRLEPVAELEWVRLSSDSTIGGLRLSGGLNLAPFPSRWPDARVGVAYAHHIDALGYWRDSRVAGQVAVGF